MSKDTGISVPGGIGGLVRYDSEYKSKFAIEPAYVIVFIVLILFFVLGLKVFWSVAA